VTRDTLAPRFVLLQFAVVARPTQRERAEELQRLHAREQLMVVPNAWDAASARLMEAVGFEALSTTSSAMAWSFGEADGENMGFENVLGVVERIASAVDIPVGVDYEGGYLDEAGDIERSVGAVLDTGAVGFGLEDTDFGAEGGVRPAEEHAELIAAAREVCSRRDVPALIVGRTELFLRTDATAEDGADEAVRRLRMYADAGADIVFAPGSEDPELIKRLVDEVPKPLNVLRLRRSTSLASLDELGVRRVTIGGAGYLVALSGLEGALRGLRDGSYEVWDEIGRPSPEVFQHVSAPRPGD
jgi:2-methylisocitrate lyase-like PEP mutase family enzyme